jgi:hypothetical protein
MHAEPDGDKPRYRKRAAKTKPWILERRVNPDFRKELVFLDREWHTSTRYATEEQANQAKTQCEKNQNHFSVSAETEMKSVWFEYRVRQA